MEKLKMPTRLMVVEGQREIPVVNHVKEWEDELQLWNLETSTYLLLIQKLDTKYLSDEKKDSLVHLGNKLSFFQKKVFNTHAEDLKAARLKKLQKGKSMLKIEQSHLRIKRSYYKVKSLLLPVLPRMVRVSIW